MIGQHAAAFDVADIADLLWRRKLRIALTGLVGFGVALAYAFGTPPIYVADGQVVVRAESSVSTDADHSFYSSVVEDGVITTEREVLGARGLANRIADNVIIPPDRGPGWLRLKFDEFAARTALDVTTTRFLDWLGIKFAQDKDVNQGDAAQVERSNRVSHVLSSWSDKGSSVINVVGTGTDPAFNAAVVNTALKFYMDDRLAAQQRSARNVEAALRERLQQTQTEIARTEERIATIMLQPGVFENASVPSSASELTLLGTRLAEAQGDLSTKQAALQSAVDMRDAAHGDPSRLVELLDRGSQSTSDFRRLLAERQQQVSGLASQVGPNLPSYIQAKRSLDSLTAQVAAEGRRLLAQRKADVAAAEQVVATLTKQYDDLRTGRSRMSPKVLTLSREQDSLANLRRINGSIEDRLIAVAAQPVDPNARVLTWAQVPLHPAFPKKSLIAAAGLIVGTGFGAVLTIARELKARARPTVSGQVGMLAGRLLGSLPDLRERRARQAIPLMFEGVALELEAVCERLDYRVLAITSAKAKEGKTTIAANLALALSRLGRRVLLINCDLHKHEKNASSLTKRFGKDAGTDEALSGVIRMPETELDVLPTCGQEFSSPTQFLRSSAFSDLICAARRTYDFVLCDTPPILSVPDPILVARVADAVVLVSEYPYGADRTVSEEISRRISASGRDICGVVVTKVTGQEAATTSYQGYGSRHDDRSMLSALTTSELRK